MAKSLEDLLAEEGFKRRDAKAMPRLSIASEGRGTGRHGSGPWPSAKRTQRTRSHIPQYDSRGEFSTSSSFSGRKLRDNLGSKGNSESDGASTSRGRIGYGGSWDAQRCNIGLSEGLQGSEITEVAQRDEIVEVGTDRPYKDIYSNNVNAVGNGSRNSSRNEERERQRNWATTDKKKYKISSFVHSLPQEHGSFEDNRKSMKQPQSSSKMSGGHKKYDESRGMRQAKVEQAFDAPALDEVAVKAVISILSEYMKRFVKNEEFRTSLRHNSFASLNISGLEEGLTTESKVMENLEQAIEIVERAAEESANSKELKRASLQLSVITGLNSNNTKSGFSSGTQNYKFSACAHLYLSVIYVLQKKDGTAAKHLLQVFCDSPFQARTTLLPDLWEQLFLPHLVDLQLWYDNETQPPADLPILANAELLKKAYNESLDSGTYKVAVYYKDWITEGAEIPSAPLIKIPPLSIQLMPREGVEDHTTNPASHISPKPIVSKKLYEEVFKRSHRSGDPLNSYREENFSSDSPAPVDKQLILYSSNSLTCTTQNFVPGNESPTDNVPTAEEARRLHPECSSRVVNLNENDGSWKRHQENFHTHYLLRELPPAQDDKLSLEKPENPAFEFKPIEESVQPVMLRFLENPEDTPQRVALETKLEPPVQGWVKRIQACFRRFSSANLSLNFLNAEQPEDYEDLSGEPSPYSIPKDFLCPLTEVLFKDPVTLETGQTYERDAIADWFDKGFLTCPVTRKPLQCRAVPPINLILKRVIHKWKTNHIKLLLALLSQMASDTNENVSVNDSMIISILEQLVTVFSEEEKLMNARRIISFGGLWFLLRRFHHGSPQEKIYILPLLSCCIEANASCRNDIARNISRLNLVELLHSEESTLRTNAVLLLIELICSNRRIQAKRFLEGLQDEEIVSAMDDLVIYLQTCSPDQTPLVAILLLHLLILPDIQTVNIYWQDAVEALTISMERSLADEKIWNKCHRALLILGGCFSSFGKLMTEDWILKLAGFLNGPDWDIADNEANGITSDPALSAVNSLIEDEDEANAREKWLASLSAALLEHGKKSFLDGVSKCLSLGNLDMVRVCLTTAAWLSSSLPSLPDTKIQLCAFSVLVSPLKQCLEYGELVEHKILASLSLFNFSIIPECRELLMKFAEEIRPSLENLAAVTWTAKELKTMLM